MRATIVLLLFVAACSSAASSSLPDASRSDAQAAPDAGDDGGTIDAGSDASAPDDAGSKPFDAGHDAAVCMTGARRCAGENKEQCGIDQQWENVGACNGTTQHCVLGLCQ